MKLKSFNTYVINLEKDKHKWEKMQSNFKNTHIKLIRFNAIYGANLTEDDKNFKQNHITKKCNLICTDGIIGCGLSHIKLANYIINNEKNYYSLVLEDDVNPIVSNFRNEIIKEINNAPNDADIIKIYYHGACKNPNSKFLMCGSTAGYIITKKGAEKLSNFKLDFHIDWQMQQTSNFIIYNSNKILLSENVEDSTISERNILNKIDNININGLNPISWYFNQAFFKIPYFNINITFIKFMIFLYIITFLFFKLKGSIILSNFFIILIFACFFNLK